MPKWKCEKCGEKVKSREKPPHCPNGHQNIVKTHQGPLEYIMNKLNFRV